MTIQIAFDNSYARLPAAFHARVHPVVSPAPRLLALNRSLARELGLDPDALATPEGLDILSGRSLPGGADPIATAYAGHQFGNFVPQLGDGRAILLGEVVGADGQRHDIQLKGSGPTPFSRGGDGRAALGPVLREYIVSEAMAALGIPTTRALAAVSTGDSVMREAVLPGAMLTRVAASHIRVGTFQFFAARRDEASLKALADHAIARHDLQAAEALEPYRAFLEGVVRRQGDLVGRWLLVGFVHGVMNTDNMAVSGETIDYGPCAFLDAYDPTTVFSSIDRGGRYAYGNQPGIAQWNLVRLAECLLPLLADETEAAIEIANAALSAFGPAFEASYHGGLCRKIGLMEQRDGDLDLARGLLDAMAETQADFTATFRALCAAAASAGHDETLRRLFAEPAAFDAWAVSWRARLALEPGHDGARPAAMRAVNPALVPRNHLVEAALTAAVERDDVSPFERLNAALAHPYDDRPEFADLAAPPVRGGPAYRTFCGT